MKLWYKVHGVLYRVRNKIHLGPLTRGRYLTPYTVYLRHTQTRPDCQRSEESGNNGPNQVHRKPFTIYRFLSK
jgi:hypothetical protein